MPPSALSPCSNPVRKTGVLESRAVPGEALHPDAAGGNCLAEVKFSRTQLVNSCKDLGKDSRDLLLGIARTAVITLPAESATRGPHPVVLFLNGFGVGCGSTMRLDRSSELVTEILAYIRSAENLAMLCAIVKGCLSLAMASVQSPVPSISYLTTLSNSCFTLCCCRLWHPGTRPW